MADPPLLRLTDGVTSVDFGGQSASYELQIKGWQPSTPSLASNDRSAGLQRDPLPVLAYRFNNRIETLRFWLSADDAGAVEPLTNPINRLLEGARLTGVRRGATTNRQVWLLYREATSTVTHCFRVINGELHLPDGWTDYPRNSGLVFDCTLTLECAPGIEEPADVVIVEQTGTDANPYGSGLYTNATNRVTMPRLIPQMDAFGGIVTWRHYADYAWNGTEFWLADETNNHQRFRVRKTNTTNRLELSSIVDTPTPTTVVTYINLNAENYQIGWHQIGVQWGDAAGPNGIDDYGLRLWLDGVPSTTGDAGADSPLSETPTTPLLAVRLGCKTDGNGSAVGAVDDIRIFRQYDGALLESMPLLYAAGREADRYTVTDAISGTFIGDNSSPSQSAITHGRGDLLPTHWAGSVLLNPASGTLGRLLIANSIDQTGNRPGRVQAEDFTPAGSASVVVDTDCSAGNRLASAGGTQGTLAARGSYNLLLGPAWNGRVRIFARVRKVASGANLAQLKLTQGDPSSSKASDILDLTDLATNVWTLIEFGRFTLPIWDVPLGGRFTVTATLYDDGAAAHQLDWDYLDFLPYEDGAPLFNWEPTYGLSPYERLVLEEERVYRFGGYDFVAATGNPGRFPSLLPDHTPNTLMLAGLRTTDDESNLTDAWQLALAYRPRYLHFRDSGGA